MAEGKDAMRTVLFLLLAGVAGGALAQQYRWTDDQGRVHYTDTPPPASAREVSKKELKGSVVSSEAPFELQLAVKNAPVTLYTSPTCKEGCAAARDALNKRGVPFKEVQVWDEETNALLKRVSGSNQVPALVVGRSRHTGYEQGAYDKLLDIAGYPKAGSVPERRQAAPPPPEGYEQAVKPAAAATNGEGKPPAQ